MMVVTQPKVGGMVGEGQRGRSSDDNAGAVSVVGHGDSELASCVGYGVVV
jgi:hypothetical protein